MRPRDSKLSDTSKKRSPNSDRETLFDQVARTKARWLKRVMYESDASSTQKCFAYIVADHLNCVTLDAWPGQERIGRLLGCKHLKTAQRASGGLVRLGFLRVHTDRKGRRHYAPVFTLDGEDKFAATADHYCPNIADNNDHQSFLPTHVIESFPTEAASRVPSSGAAQCTYKRSQRGEIEVQIAARLGRDGWKILGLLSARDDAVVERLCKAFAGGLFGDREAAAARLASQQM